MMRPSSRDVSRIRRAFACRWRRAAALGLLLIAPAAAVSAADETPKQLKQHPVVQAADWEKATDIVIELGDHHYAPDDIELRVGQPYRIVLNNTGTVSHDMVGGTLFDENVIALRMVTSRVGRITANRINSVYLRSGNSTEIWLVPLKVGEYSFFCSLPGHLEDGMEGTIKIVP